MLSQHYVLDLVNNLILEENNKFDISKITIKSKIIDELNFDSLMMAQLIIKIQEDTGENLFERGVDLSKLITIEDILNGYNKVTI